MAEYLRNQLAKLAGVSIETLRYYEQKGLITPERTANHYRVYSEATVDQLNFIKRAKEAGFTLAEIRKTLLLFEYSMEYEEISSVMIEGIAEKLQEIENRIARLNEIRELLTEMYDGLRQQQRCPAMQSLLKQS